jgi:hypothetical protein
MAKKRKKKSSGPITPLLLVLSFLIATLGVYSYIRFKPVGPAEIFIINGATLEPGYVELSGFISRDAPPNEPGSYYLTLYDGQLIELDSDDLSDLLGVDATVTGELFFLDDSSPSPYLVINSITVGE